jgi:DegV family protein with EDD domain
VIIDSCCDLPLDFVESLDVEVLNFTFVMDDGEHLDDLCKSMSSHEFYERLRKGEDSKTTQVPLGLIADMFEKAVLEGVPTVFLCFSSTLSGTYDSAQLVLGEIKEKYPDAELYVVDTKLASAAEGLLVIEAMRQCDRGLSAKELAAWAEEARWYVHGYFTLADMETLRRGGRIPDMAAFAGAKLDLKPILTFDLDGRLSFFGAARGRKKSIRQLLSIYTDRARQDPSNIVLVTSADAPKEQRELAEEILNMPTHSAVWTTSIGPVIGSHVGADMLALVFWGPDRRLELSITDRIANAVGERSEAIRARFSGNHGSTNDND